MHYRINITTMNANFISNKVLLNMPSSSPTSTNPAQLDSSLGAFVKTGVGYFGGTFICSLLDCAVTHPLAQLATQQQRFYQDSFSQNFRRTFFHQNPYLAFRAGLQAKILSRGSGLLIGNVVMPSQWKEINYQHTVKAGLFAGLSESVATTGYISQVRLSQTLGTTHPPFEKIITGMRHAMWTHCLKNWSTYIPVFAASKLITDDNFYGSLYGAGTVMAIQHWTSLLDWKMTLEITNSKKQSLSSVIEKINWPQFNKMVSTRMVQYSLGYFITLFLSNKITQKINEELNPNQENNEKIKSNIRQDNSHESSLFISNTSLTLESQKQTWPLIIEKSDPDLKTHTSTSLNVEKNDNRFGMYPSSR